MWEYQTYWYDKLPEFTNCIFCNEICFPNESDANMYNLYICYNHKPLKTFVRCTKNYPQSCPYFFNAVRVEYKNLRVSRYMHSKARIELNKIPNKFIQEIDDDLFFDLKKLQKYLDLFRVFS